MKQPPVTIAELARRTGMTEGQIRGRISDGYWVEGTHYFRRGRRLMMDVEACSKFWTDTAVKTKRRR